MLITRARHRAALREARDHLLNATAPGIAPELTALAQTSPPWPATGPTVGAVVALALPDVPREGLRATINGMDVLEVRRAAEVVVPVQILSQFIEPPKR